MGKKRIAVAGLYSLPNMGDLILCEVTGFLIQQFDEDIETVKLDVYPKKRTDRTLTEKIKRRISARMIKKAKSTYAYEDGSPARYRYERRMWELQLADYYRKVIKDADAVVFAGGGFLKFRTQGLNYYAEMIIELAEEYGIPVMMNAVGIEGYDDNDARCRSLKEHINRDTVKVITTRDNYGLLKNSYIHNPNTVIGAVGDPALWSPECYGINRADNRELYGINIIRGNIFKDYGNSLTSDQLMNFYKQLIGEMDRRKLPWIMFSNGMRQDQRFAERTLEALGYDAAEKLLPAPATAEALLEIERNFKCIFGARLHACITSYSMDIPVVGFIWNEKTEIFAQQIGKSRNFFHENELDVRKIVDRMEQAATEEYDSELRKENREKTVRCLYDFLGSLMKR